uniref:A disintegrin and metalloproteinase with thrombospondin motifs adt-1 isoform X2 n=1 Tax=Ciona intestinalis TaxID=7719 RepID=UPI00089DCE4F|nr:A disintegrin and metalloproteinase with thrombospondin motifs adt-1 isoform X2 [Ciona intestinalis]|eukprot:XP_018671668.1 A disintegrin and metalloproteinase with thrombospondin motifs adt-1 isoform X2 [Ciona intestinalis]
MTLPLMRHKQEAKMRIWSIDAPFTSPSSPNNLAPGSLNSLPGTTVALASSHRDVLVNAHNQARRTTSPTATNMLKMTWDNELAVLAANYARKCLFAHNRDRSHSRFHPVGENIYISSGKAFNTRYGSDAVRDWNNEKVDYNYQTRTCTPNRMCGHYTQVVWAETFKVGCGVATCPTVNVRGNRWTDATILICNYGPGGNYINSAPFESGATCSNCHSSDSCENKLCTNRGRDALNRPAASWLSWTPWTTCSKTCGYVGTRRRSRECNTFVNKDCGNKATEFDFTCASIPCGGTTTSGSRWNSWTQWTTCPVTCGGGRKTRERTCTTGRIQDCDGPNQQLLSCNRRPCPNWNSWRQWGSCSETCGSGRRRRSRSCNTGTDSDCVGTSESSDVCNTNVCPTGWSAWEPWGRCSHSCNRGIQLRRRRCLSLSSTDCPGSPSQTQACNSQSCTSQQAVWSNWSAWSACSTSCGNSVSTSTRTCSQTNACTGRTQKTKNCRKPACTTSNWSAWGLWSTCSKTCGSGTRSKQRTCILGNTGPACSGQSVARQACATNRCPYFLSWGSWSVCSTTCGSGTKHRSRPCSTGNTADCRGRKRQQRQCSVTSCTLSGWQSWGVWGQCSKTCGGGIRERIRQCDRGNSDQGCDGDTTSTQRCNQQICPAYSGWSGWSSCSVTCGHGVKIRNRICNTGRNSDCTGAASNSQACMKRQCTVSGWSPWTSWVECSKTCGGGTTSRNRLCNVGTTGGSCSGATSQDQICNSHSCPVYSAWSQWSTCSTTCGVGYNTRKRECSSQTDACSGASTLTRVCSIGRNCTRVLEDPSSRSDVTRSPNSASRIYTSFYLSIYIIVALIMLFFTY